MYMYNIHAMIIHLPITLTPSFTSIPSLYHLFLHPYGEPTVCLIFGSILRPAEDIGTWNNNTHLN